jgi:hypothetical protein
MATSSDHNGSYWVRFWQSWSDFWFRPADPTPLAFIRILTGAVAFYVILAYSVDLQELLGVHAWVDHSLMEEYRKEHPFRARANNWHEVPRFIPANSQEELDYMGRWQVNPRAALAKGLPIWSIWFHVTDPTAMVIVHCGILLVIFLFTIGAATRITAVLTWFGVISYTHRAATTVFGMDTMMNILLIYLMIGPSGAALSVDRMVRRYWMTARALRARRTAPEIMPPKPLPSANLTIRLIQVHLCIIYLAAGLSKLRGNAWWTGQAIWGTLANPEFSPMHVPAYLAVLRFLSENRWLWEVCMNLSVLFTLFMEIGFPFLVWVRPLRWIMLAVAALMHIGIAVFMGLNTFSLFMMTMLVAFVPLEAIQWLLRLPGRNAPRLKLQLDNRARPQVRAASLVRAVDAWDQVELTAEGADTEPARLRLSTESGDTVTGFSLWQRLASSLPVLFVTLPPTWLLALTGVGRALFGGDVETAGAVAPVENGMHRRREEKVSR